MFKRIQRLIPSAFPLAGILLLLGFVSLEAGEVKLYTPYTKIAVSPGESIDYTIDVINNSSEIQNVGISLAGMPKGWNYTLKSSGWNIQQISVLPNDKKSITLHVEVPLKIEKGSYRFRLVAAGFTSLPLTVMVSERGTFKTEFTTNQPNMQGNATSTFTFNAELKNSTADKQLYALMADAPRGWSVIFKVNYKQVTSAEVDANKTEKVTIEIKPPDNIEAGKYKIPVQAVTSSTSASLNLEVVITGTYKMELTTPSGLLSTSITSGRTKKIKLLVRNTGSSELLGIQMEYSAPVNWEVSFDPKRIDRLAPGEETQVITTIKADRKAIPGDYMTNMDAKTPEVSARAAFRITVKAPMLWGWVGILVILAAAGSVYYLFRKYGRR